MDAESVYIRYGGIFYSDTWEEPYVMDSVSSPYY